MPTGRIVGIHGRANGYSRLADPVRVVLADATLTPAAQVTLAFARATWSRAPATRTHAHTNLSPARTTRASTYATQVSACAVRTHAPTTRGPAHIARASVRVARVPARTTWAFARIR